MNPIPRVIGLALLVVLAGCSTQPAQQARVAALHNPASTTEAVPMSVPSTPPTVSRPRERLDMTVDEIHALTETYHKCLADNGYDTFKAKEAAAKGTAPDESKRPGAEAACLSKKPLPPWEYDLANPESANFVHGVVKCLRDKGVKHVDEAPLMPSDDSRVSQIALGGPNNDAQSISKGLNFLPTCEKEQTHQ